jgi:hypothetical protein
MRKDTPCAGSRYRGLSYALAMAVTASACVHPRPLTRREAAVRVVENEPSTIEALRRDCQPVGEVVAISNPLDAEDDARRGAGERQAQVALKVMGLASSGVFNCQFWRCPGSRADKPGYLAWQRGKGLFDQGLRLVQNGKVVDDGTFRGLDGLLAREPAAIEHAKRAEAKMQHARSTGFTAVGLLSVALAGAGVAAYGSARHKVPLLLGGLGVSVVFTSVGWGFAASAANAASEGTTEAMNAVDLYNGDYPQGGR